MPEQLTKEELKAIAAEARQEMLRMLSKRPYTASEIARAMGKHVTTVSEHLENLERTGLVRKKEEGHKWKYYVLTPKGEKLFKPQFYSWAIILSISAVAIILGGGLLTLPLYVGSAAYSREAAIQAPSALQIEAPSAPDFKTEFPADVVSVGPFEIVAIVLIALGIAGIIWAVRSRKKAKVQVLS